MISHQRGIILTYTPATEWEYNILENLRLSEDCEMETINEGMPDNRTYLLPIDGAQEQSYLGTINKIYMKKTCRLGVSTIF